MEPPVTPKLMPASSPDLPTDHTSKLFGIVYITLTGVVDTIILAAGPWSWVRKSASYLLKLAPFLWWALPTKTLAQITPRNGGPAAQDWVPDNGIQEGTASLREGAGIFVGVADALKNLLLGGH
ncbi:hypothetical protein DSO57_1000589 [Entomophthora muscae]|uniref:Uncharacterized protein n=1 Tax=Entomophthora muscae TaxID=34485 RepID=A0ACC2S094_9FUNG|nr:hypothetical protein DSO57_1000589 [Entomophthora muscae]